LSKQAPALAKKSNRLEISCAAALEIHPAGRYVGDGVRLLLFFLGRIQRYTP